MKSGCDQRAPVGLRIVGLRGPEAGCQGARSSAGLVSRPEVVHQLLQAALEPLHVLVRQARADEAEAGHERRLLDLARGLSEGAGGDRPAASGILGLVAEEAGPAGVEPLRERPPPPGAARPA